MSESGTETLMLLKKWHGGNQESLEILLERHLPWIQSHIRRRLSPLLREKAETNDYVQDAMIQFLRYGPRISISNGDHFRRLLVLIIENSIRNKYDWYTAKRRAHALEKPLPSDTVLSLDPPKNEVKTPSQSVERHEGEAWIRLAMELIDPEDREVLILRQWDELSFQEIGENLKISSDAARKRFTRAVSRLARKVGDLRRSKIKGILDIS